MAGACRRQRRGGTGWGNIKLRLPDGGPAAQQGLAVPNSCHAVQQHMCRSALHRLAPAQQQPTCTMEMCSSEVPGGESMTR